MKMQNKTYHVITIGCQMNKSDSERISGYLEKFGYKRTRDKMSADLVVLVTCGVRQSAEDRVYGLIPKLKKKNPGVKIVLTGCLSERKDVRKRLKKYVDVWLPITELDNFMNFINHSKQKAVRFKIKDLSYYLNIKPEYESRFSAFVPIGNGCDNFCAYCVVPYARGREVYRPVEDILEEARGLAESGYKEIILIAQNVNSYASEITNSKRQILNKFKIQNSKSVPGKIQESKIINFAKLLRLVNDIKGEFWIRFATSHPKDMSDELIKTIAECDKVCKHIHLPAQAGDDEVLRAMNRKYTREHYLKLISRIRRECKAHKSEFLPVAVTTDIIVGFPGETRAQFNNTIKLFKEAKFDMAYIARYSPRPGTKAAKMNDDVPASEKKRREEELMKILRKAALENNKKYIGKVVEVLVEGKNKKGEWRGKTRTGKKVKFRIMNHELRIMDFVGRIVNVKIESAEDFGINGKIII